MTILRFEGIVDADFEGLSIGERDVIVEIQKTSFTGPVTVALADEKFTGDLEIYDGTSSYSEWTPGDPAGFFVGGHDVLDRLEEYYNGKVVILWIADEPINTLDPPPSWANQG